DSCINNTIFGNRIYNNSEDGIFLFNSSFNNIFGNNIYDNEENGFYLNSSDNNILADNIIRSNNKRGILIEHSIDNMIKGNLVENSTMDGLRLYYCNFSQLLANIFNNNSRNGMGLYYSNNNTISGNIANFNLEDGYLLSDSFNNMMYDNTGKNHQDYGMLLMNSDGNDLYENILIDNEYGIGLSDSHNNEIKENMVNGSLHAGIYLYESNYSRVLNNNVYNNTGNGIEIEVCYYNIISENIVNNNLQDGINLFDMSTNNNVTENIVKDNVGIGIHFLSLTVDNLIGENILLRNGKHAVDDGSGNDWNSTIIGNYWDNHTGPDTTPQDGIVDVPYIYIGGTAGSTDYLPIAEDGAPMITINSPKPGDAFNNIAPSFNVRITDILIDIMWYTLDAGLNNYTFTENGTIDQAAWNAMPEGDLTLRFCARDLPGSIGAAEVIINKDTQAPIINILSPTSGDVIGATAPSFNITIVDSNLDTVWYSLDNGLNNYTISTFTGTIDQLVWDALSQGEITLTIYANDTVGNLASEGVTITLRIPSGRAIGLDYLTTSFLIFIMGGLAVLMVIVRIYSKRWKNF
ncbi:MAG: NosD domain-containing protein, partial [Promethearchaeota archaeon]